MKPFILSILALLFSLQVFATAQIPDRIIYKGDTLSLFANPLELYPNFDSLKLTSGIISSCWRGYIAEWEIIDNHLYLIGIFACFSYTKRELLYDLKDLFGSQCIDGKVKADWVTGTLTSPQGKLLYYVHDAYESIYERDLEFHFEKGKLQKTLFYDNSKAKQSVYSQNQEKKAEYIYSRINWKILPKQDTIVRVVVHFSANENGIIDEAKVVRGYNKVYDQEAIRIVKSIPEWDVYFRKGKHIRIQWSMPIVFSEENRLKYQK